MQLHPGPMRRMWTRRGSAPRKVALVGAGAIVAGAIFLGSSDSASDRSDPAAQIPGAPLEPQQPASEIAAFANLAEATPIPEAKPTRAPIAAPAIELDKITEEADRYVAKLADGRSAALTLQPELQHLAEKLLDDS